jgi:hypothetical protein
MNNKKLRIWIVFPVISLFLLLAMSTNPPVEKHRAEVKTKFGTILQKSLAENLDKNEVNNPGVAIGTVFSSMFGSVILNPLIDSFITADNYLFFSVTKLKWNEKSNIIGFGAFGHVFITNNLDKDLK